MSRYHYSSIPSVSSSTFTACTDCGVLVWDQAVHERKAHADDPESEEPNIVPARAWRPPRPASVPEEA